MLGAGRADRAVAPNIHQTSGSTVGIQFKKKIIILSTTRLGGGGIQITECAFDIHPNQEVGTGHPQASARHWI